MGLWPAIAIPAFVLCVLVFLDNAKVWPAVPVTGLFLALSHIVEQASPRPHKNLKKMTPMFKTGSRKWDIHYSIVVNGERHEKTVPIESQSAKHAEQTLRSRFSGQDVDLEIHSINRKS